VLTPLGRSEWKIRFAPREIGEYRYTISVDDGEKLVTEPRSFVCIASRNPGFVRVSQQDTRYFEFDNGDFYYPIGHNIPATYNVKASEILGLNLLKQEGTFAYDRFLKGMSDNSENYARIWLASWSFGLEWSPKYDVHFKGLGRYNLENAWKFDYVMDQAQRKGVYVQLALTTFGHYRSETFEGDWGYSPYNSANGGFLQSPQDFWGSERAWDYYRRMLRYAMARWGYNTNIAAWELCNEIDLVSNYNAMRPRILTWHEKCAEWISRFDQGHRPITTNFSQWPKEEDILRLPGIGFSSTNHYELKIVTALEKIYRLKSPLNKPALVIECGADFKGSSPATTERYIQICIWSSYMMPLAGAGMQWWWDFIDDHDLYFYFKALAEYARGEERRGQNLEIAQAKLRHSDGLEARCLMNSSKAYLWIYDTALLTNDLDPTALKEHSEAELSVEGLADGRYRAEFWDTTKGVVIGEQEATVNDGPLTITLPTFVSNIAVKVKPTPR
jgi:hypothetical protein